MAGEPGDAGPLTPLPSTRVEDVWSDIARARLKWFLILAPAASLALYGGLALIDAAEAIATMLMVVGLGVGITANVFLIRGCYALGTAGQEVGGSRWPSVGLWMLLLLGWVGISLTVGSVLLGIAFG